MSGRPGLGGPFAGRLAVAVLAVVLGLAGALAATQGAAAAAPANDALADAAELDGFACGEASCETTVSGSNAGATVEDGEDALGLCSTGATVWYRLNVTEATTVTLTLESDFGATLAAATGNGSFDGFTGGNAFCGDGQPWLAPVAGQPPVNNGFAAAPGTWWVQVGGAPAEDGAQTGSFTLRVTLGAAFGVLPASSTLRTNEKGAFTVDVRGQSVGAVDWDFGDNSTGEGDSVVHRWTATGAYPVTATGALDGQDVLIDGEGAPVGPQAAANVTVVRAALAARFDVDPVLLLREEVLIALSAPSAASVTDPVRAQVGAPLRFTEQALGGSGPLTFSWDFGDGGSDGNGTAVHAYAAIGAFPAKLTVRDGAGHAASLARTIHVYDEAPLVGHGDPGGNATLDAPGYLSITCQVGADAAAVDFDGLAVVAADAIGLGDGSAPLGAAHGALFASIQGGPQPGQCERVTITLLYTAAGLATAGAPESRLHVYYWTGAQWVLLRAPSDVKGSTPAGDLHVFSTAIDAAADEAIVVVNHTSTYALGSPAGGGGGGGGGSAPAPAPGDSGDAPAPAPAPGPADPSGDSPAAGDGDAGTGAAGASGPGSGDGHISTASAEPASIAVQRPDGSPVPGADGPGATLGGTVELVARNAPTDGTRFVLVGAAGEQVLEPDSSGGSAQWDTAAADNGRYRVELRDGDGTVLASASYLVYNGRADALAATAAALAGAAVMGAGFLLSTLLNAVREGATAVGEDKFRERTKRHRVTAWLARVPSLPSLLIGVPAFVAFFTLDGMDRLDWAGYLARLPYVAAAGAIVFAAAYSLEILLNVASGARSRFQLLLTGFLALATSTLVFRTAFGYPGFVEEEEAEGGLPRRVEGLRSVALLLVILALAAPFFLVLSFGSFPLGETGMAIALSLLATSSLPFRPVPGANVWRWSKTLSVALVLATFGLFVAFEAGLVPLVDIALAGLGGLAGFAVLYAWLRRRPKGMHGGSEAERAHAPAHPAPLSADPS